MVSGARRRLADMLAAQSIPAEPEHLSDEFNRGVAAALERRGIGRMPGLRSAAEEAQEAHRQRVRQVVDALTPPRPPAPPPAPEPVRETLPQQIRALLGQQTGEQSDAPALNSAELIRKAAGG
jgi:hypothetical protein